MALADDLRTDLLFFFDDDAVGRAMSVQRKTFGEIDPATGAAASERVKSYPGRGRMGDYSDYLRNNTSIEDNDRRATFVPDDITFEPMANDTLVVSGDVSYAIVRVKKREIGGVLISYTLQVRA